MSRSDDQLERHKKALIERFRRSMHDRAKLAILTYMEQNPAWQPEELKIMTNYYIRKYALNNRYVPAVPKDAIDATFGKEESTKVEPHADTAGTEGTPSSQESG